MKRVERYCYGGCGRDYVGRSLTCSPECAQKRRRWLRALNKQRQMSRQAREELLAPPVRRRA